MIKMECCYLDDQPIIQAGDFGPFSCIATQSIVYIQAGSHWPVAMNQNVDSTEPCGRPLVFANPLDPATANPVVPYNGCNLRVHGTLVVGGVYMGRKGGASFAWTKGLDVGPHPTLGAGPGGVVVSNKSTFYGANQGCAYIEASGVPGIRWLKDSDGRLPPASRMSMNCGGADLMIGRDIGTTPPIALADLQAVHSGRYQLAAGNDQSYVINSGWDTVDSAYNDGE